MCHRVFILDPRLERRAKRLVIQHANSTLSLAAGMKSLPSRDAAFADTQGLWRFLNVPRVKSADLTEPLLRLAEQGINQGCDAYVRRYTIGRASISTPMAASLFACA